MSCYNNCYLPQPTRTWSRVQNRCSVINDTNNGLVIDPYTKQLVPNAVLAERIAMLNKGNILQYKANSSSLTKSQKYSKIAKGQWTNRNTTWATQSSRGYTNPNNSSLKRGGNVVNVAIDPVTGLIIGPTLDPVTCLDTLNPFNEGLPTNENSGSNNEPEVPPNVELSGNDDFPSIIPDALIQPIVIQDEGNLICSVQENICTGETKYSISQQLCHPTTDSNVPGPIQDLCWNDGTQTWYPRQRYVMTNSGSKWPQNAKLLGAIQIYPPYITSVVSGFNKTTIEWTFDSSCLPATNFNIYQNNLLINVVPGNIFTITLDVINCNTYEYYIIAINPTAQVTSEPSNIVTTYVSYIEPPINLVQVSQKLSEIINLVDGFANVQIAWTPSPNNCGTIIGYNVYQNNILISTVLPSMTSYTITNLPTNNTYNFNVTSLAAGIESSFSSTLTVTLPVIYTTTGSPLDSFTSGNIMLKYLSNGTFNFNYDLLMEYTLVGGGGGGGLWSIGTSNGSPGGGGGHIINTNSPRVVSKDIFSLVVGSGGPGGNNYGSQFTSIGTIGSNSSMVGTFTSFYISTNNSGYSGQGGRGAINVSWEGGGGLGDNVTSANGGIVVAVVGSPPYNGTGGAGGSLTLVNSSNAIVTTILGETGFNNQIMSGGNGGAGNQGIDGLYYGGGGGGGGANLTSMFKGFGGNGGGGDGTQINPLEAAENGKLPGGGGGGSNAVGGLPQPQPPLPGNGANGIIIINFTNPP